MNETTNHIEKLLHVADSFATQCNNVSAEIRQIEKGLTEKRITYPFGILVEEDNWKIVDQLPEKYKNSVFATHGLKIQRQFFLAWDNYAKQNDFRFLLIEQEVHDIVMQDVDQKLLKAFTPHIITIEEKPLAECKIHVRLHYGKYIKQFVQEFTDFLLESYNNVKESA